MQALERKKSLEAGEEYSKNFSVFCFLVWGCFLFLVSLGSLIEEKNTAIQNV